MWKLQKLYLRKIQIFNEQYQFLNEKYRFLNEEYGSFEKECRFLNEKKIFDEKTSDFSGNLFYDALTGATEEDDCQMRTNWWWKGKSLMIGLPSKEKLLNSITQTHSISLFPLLTYI